jgi:hypothetical protein
VADIQRLQQMQHSGNTLRSTAAGRGKEMLLVAAGQAGEQRVLRPRGS